MAVNQQAGTSYTLQSGDLGDRVEMSGSAAKSVTVPQMATVPGTAGTKAPGATNIVTSRAVHVEPTVTQIGTGAVTLTADVGVTITGAVATAGDGRISSFVGPGLRRYEPACCHDLDQGAIADGPAGCGRLVVLHRCPPGEAIISTRKRPLSSGS